MKFIKYTHHRLKDCDLSFDFNWGLVEGGFVCPIDDPFTLTTAAIEVNPASVAAAAEILRQCRAETNPSADQSRPNQLLRLEQITPLPPTFNNPKIICIGKNYSDHAREMGGEPPTIPVVFSKFSSALTPHRSEIFLPPISDQVDFEAELVVVIGKRGKNITRQNAMQHVLGYSCGNDISARDWQKEKPGGQWLLGKTFDTFAPLGPYLVTSDEVGDPHQLDIQLRLNGQTMQSANTNQLIFPIDYLISHLSQFTTLMPGDLLFTGTPSGVGAARKPPIFLTAGDVLEVQIQNVGTLHNTVANQPLAPH